MSDSMRAWRTHAYGDRPTEVLRLDTVPIPEPDAGELRVRVQAIPLNLNDLERITGGNMMVQPDLPYSPGMEVIGVVDGCGAGTESWQGRRVFATAGSDEKVRLCRELGAEVAINYCETDFVPAVLEATGKRGVDVVFDNVGEAVMEQSMRCIAYNGRYLMMGFASNKVVADEPFIVPRRVALGNFKLCGVLLAYAQPEMSELLKDAMGWNFASDALGAEIARKIVDLVLAGTIKPVIGRVVDFEDLPAAMEALANRETIGRTIVQVA